MSSISELKQIVKDYLQVESPAIVDTTLNLGGGTTGKEAVIDRLILRGANNARKWAEKKHEWSFADVTLAGVVPSDGTGLSFDELWEGWQYYGLLVVAGGAGVGLVSNIYNGFAVLQSSDPGWTGDSLVVYDQAGSFTSTLVTITGGAFPSYSISSSLADGTYTVWVMNCDASDYNTDSRPYDPRRYVKVKTVRFFWQYYLSENYIMPLRFESKIRTADRLIEHLDRQSDSIISLNQSRINLHGRKIFTYPYNTEDVLLYVDVNRWLQDYLLDSDTDQFLVHGFEFMQWATIVETNRLLQRFVIRQEGNLPPPTAERDRALQDFIEWDIYQTEADRNIQLD